MDTQTDTVGITEAAVIIGVHDKTVRRLVKAGELASHRVPTATGFEYRINRADAEAERDKRLDSISGSELPITALAKVDKRLDAVQATVREGFEGLHTHFGQVAELQQELAGARQELVEAQSGAEAAETKAEELREALAAEKARSWWQRLWGRGDTNSGVSEEDA